MNIKRITRLLKLLQTLQAGQGDNADGLAKSCGVSRRTAFRDLETLKAAGVPLHFDKDDGRYSIAGDFFLQPTNFTASEALSIIALASELGAENQLPFFGPARTAALKLQNTLPAAVRRELQAVAKSIHVRLQPLGRLPGHEAVYQRLVQAIADRRVALITYQSLTEWESIETPLRPYQLLFNWHTWYVIGRSSLHGGPRTFNLGRIQRIELLNQKYARPRGFSVERYLGNAWNLMPHPGPDSHVVIQFSPLVAQNVAEVAWHKTQWLEFQSDGSLVFHADVSGLNEIVWWILGHGDQAQVFGPPKLRRLVAQRAKNLHLMYC
jgi:predicted DNA-binding transcriptional regulator YafY